ncbi:MAG: hypothetical protein MZW92_65430 [Comamonadaceae bacterium]|nr:hypothetical protein [Comamonadaceae bacterium]
MLTEDYYVFNKLAKGLVGTNNIDTNSRLCMSSAVAGYKATLGADAPPCLLRRPRRTRTACSSPAPTRPGRTRCCSAASRTRARANPAHEGDRRRPAPHRDRRRGRPAPAAAARHRRRAVPRACCTCCCGRAWSTRAYIARAHRAASTALRDRGARVHARAAAAQVCGVAGRATSCTAARWFAATARRPTLSLWCQGLNQSQQRHRQERRADQPAPGHRADRPARAPGRSR